MADRVEIRVLDRDGQSVGILDRATKFDVTRRWVDLGAIAISARTSAPAVAELGRGGSLAVMLDGEVFASGPVLERAIIEDPTGELLTTTGPDDMIRLKWRLALPGAPGTNPAAAVSQDRTGAVEDVIYAYTDANLGPAAASAGRQLVALAPSLHRGSTVNESVRNEPLLDVATRLAIIDGFGMSCRWDPVARGLPVFKVEASRDLRAEVQFSKDRNTISKSTLTDVAPSATHVLVGGAGDGIARSFEEVVDDTSAAEWWRIEVFVDAGDTSDPDTLTQRAQSELQQSGLTLTFDAAETVGLAYGPAGWMLGDIVTGIAGGITDVYVIVEIKLTGPPLRLVPTLAQFAGFRLGQLQAVRDRIVAQRVRSLETRT